MIKTKKFKLSNYFDIIYDITKISCSPICLIKTLDNGPVFIQTRISYFVITFKTASNTFQIDVRFL